MAAENADVALVAEPGFETPGTAPDVESPDSPLEADPGRTAEAPPKMPP